ncbi:protein of unassigned function [Methylobacterium oryzae CBMB20]|uniref:Protein of unassigned function n=1 Tax=Methylobacterium oryzae CBMB20 TaxID=693986 RepID=A0A089Q9R5_9HYPH|nr:protein of unassigned function [Methylobacterium oryzae CBMB20]
MLAIAMRALAVQETGDNQGSVTRLSAGLAARSLGGSMPSSGADRSMSDAPASS